MLKNLLILEDGTEITSGVGTVNAIQSAQLTQSVNSGEELTLGSVCAAMLEATLFTPGGALEVSAGQRVTLYKLRENGTRKKVGVFLLEQPVRPSANRLQVTGYDPVILLEKELSEWLESLDNWPYTLQDFAGMVCSICGLTLVTGEIPNGDFPVEQFSYPEVTGRQLMRWIGEICGCFCRANADGDIELSWYTAADRVLTPEDYFGKGLTYETYQVAPIEGVQVKLADSDTGALWPQLEDGANTYVISGNPMLLSDVSAELLPYLEVLQQRLAALQYTPCSVKLPVNLEIGAGSIVDITDSNGVTITTLVMTKINAGQRDTLECTGSYRRDSAAANAAKPNKDAEKIHQLQLAVKAIDGNKVVSLINLSEDGVRIKGPKIELEGIVTANDNFKILSTGSAEMKNATLSGKITANDGKIAGWTIDDNSIRYGSLGTANSMWLCRNGTGTSGNIGGSGSQSGWCIAVGKKFGVDKNGAAYASDLHIHGGSVKIVHTQGYGGQTIIDESGLLAATGDYSEGETGAAMKFSSHHIQHEEDGNTYPMIYVGYDEYIEEYVKRLEGIWHIDALASSPVITSDREAKLEIQDQAEVYSQLFDKLRPVTFKYKNGTSGRTHTGLIAQEVEDAVLSLGLTTQEFAGVCYDTDEEGNKHSYGIRYEELVSMLIAEVQQLKARVKKLEDKEETVCE